MRYGEVVRAYHVGRFVDPNHPETMHEQHPVYRVEASARWNLHPGSQNTANLLNPPPDAAFSPPPTNDAIIAEMNRQREATARVMQEAAQLAQSIDELQKIFGEMKTVARNDALLNARLANAERRSAEFEKELQMLTAAASPMTNDAPAFVPGTARRTQTMKTLYRGSEDRPPAFGEHGKCRATRNHKTNRYDQTETIRATERQRQCRPHRHAHLSEQPGSGRQD